MLPHFDDARGSGAVQCRIEADLPEKRVSSARPIPELLETLSAYENVLQELDCICNFHTFVLHHACINLSGYCNIRLCNTSFFIYFIFSDVIATYFGPLSGNHRAILTQMYHND
jgi:hypothetical protein